MFIDKIKKIGIDMKLKNSIRIVVFTGLAVILVGIFVFFSIKIDKARYTDFKDAGYVISTNYDSNSTNDDINSEKYYFSENTSYRKNNNTTYTFTNSSNEEVSINNDNFIHYNDGTIGTLKTTALLNFNNIADNIIKYYTLNNKNYLTKEGNKYLAKSVSENLEFTNFLLKISNDKYMLVAPEINIHIKDDIRQITNSYVEFQYFDGNIIRIENNSFKLQSVASDFYIEIQDNIIIDLSNKNIYLNKEQKLNLEEITIDSNDNTSLDNIDDSNFQTEDERKKAEEEAKAKAEAELAKAKKELEEAQNKIQEDIKNNFSSENPINGITNGIVKPTSPDHNDEIIDDSNNSYDPSFTITNFEVSANGVFASIKYEDKSSILIGSPTVNLIDAGNNKIVDSVHLNTGLTSITYSNETLNQNTNYVLVVNANYMKNNEAVNKDFIQKSFITKSLGINIIKDYFSTTTLNYILKLNSDSLVKSLNAKLYNKEGKLVSDKLINITDSRSVNLSFEGLTPNTTYKLELSNFVYQNMIVSDNFNIVENYQTLKRSPRIGSTSFSVDKVNSKFILETNNIEDKDNGIVKLRYEIYDMRTLDGSNTASPVKVIETSSLGSVEVNVDDETVYRAVPYTFKVIAVFNDNEKEVEIEHGYPKEYMQLDGKVHPSVSFKAADVTFERITGTVEIRDLYGTVDYYKPFKVIYTDSHGISNTITFNLARLYIPIDINGLRANNETYTFDVYGYVDLDDGYGSTNQLIGTFTVNTNNIKSFTLASKINDKSLTKAFDITAQLQATNGEDNILEANTLSNLTFNLYAGESTKGQLIKSVSYADTNLKEYESELKQTYYDKEFAIVPETFGLSNSALRSYETLTIEVTNANDYTKWPNTAPIINNVISLKTKMPIEDPETNPKVAVSYVRNKDVSKDRYDKNLNDNTIVGMRAIANYDNSNHYVKYITYYLYDASNPDKYIAKSEYLPVNDDGTIPEYVFYADYGTSKDTKDTTFRRGNSYYVTYIMDVDVNGDGTIEDDIHIPTTGIAASDTLDFPKQIPIFKTYPSTVLETSNGNKLLWAYKYTDIDNALDINKLYYKLNDVDAGSADISMSDNFQTVTINLDYSGSYNLYNHVRLLKTENYSPYELTIQNINKVTSIPTGIKYLLNLETNRLMVSIVDYDLYQSFFDKATNFKLTFTANNKVREFNDIEFDYTGTTLIDLSDLEDFINQNIEVNLYVYYDSGLIGFDTETTARDIYTPNFALKKAANALNSGGYYVVKGTSLQTQSTAFNSLFTFSLNKTPNARDNYNFNLQSGQNFQNTYELKLDEGGFKFITDEDNMYFMPSKVAVTKLASDDNNFTFTGLVPGVSLKKDGKYQIDANIDSADVTLTVSSASNTIQDDKIYFEVYETDENMIEANSKLLYTKEVNISDLDNPISLDDLKPSSYYFFKIKANVIDNGVVSYISLYDIDNKTNVINYPISTLSNLSILNQSITFKANNYTDKYLEFKYDLETIKNIDHINYQVYKVSNGKYIPLDDDVILNIQDDVNITSSMNKKISISPSSNFQTGITYAIGLKGYLKKSNGSIYELDTTYSNNFNFNQLAEPYFYIQSIRNTDESTLTFKVNPTDINYTLVNGNYTVGFYDEEGNIIPNNYTGLYKGGNTFVLTNIDLSKATKIAITYKANVNNISDEAQIPVKSRTLVVNGLNKDGIDVGDVYASQSLNDKSKINLTFSNSTRITEITSVRYTIFKDGVIVASTSGLEAFTPSSSICGTSTCYSYTLKSIISQTGIYYIQIQFLNKDGNSVDERIISYAYTI